MKTAIRRAFPTMLLLGVLSGTARAETIELQAGRDATLIENPHGALANGKGPFFFVGHTAQDQNGIRRAALFFDLSAIPDHAIAESVSLQLSLAPSNGGPVEISLHRLLADWGEGLSFSTGGSGAPSQPGDVTWTHRFFDTVPWARPGGLFVERESASRAVDVPGLYTWESTVHLVKDVQVWLAAPDRNFGWILIGDETRLQTSQSFGSRENPEASARPVLTVTYRVPSE
jgi:hypothetical protein